MNFTVFDILAELGLWWTSGVLAAVGIGLAVWVMVELWSMPEPGPRKDDADEQRG